MSFHLKPIEGGGVVVNLVTPPSLPSLTGWDVAATC